MACIQYPRKERGGVNPGSWEKPTIYRDPPKEIMTRKKERIEEGDVTYNIRNQPDRYNDAITNWQKGKNMMVKVDYQNRTQQMTTMDFGSASNPYKVNQAFRPPAMRQVDLQPLSRQQRPYTSAQTNIGSLMTRDDHGVTRIDQTEIAFTTNVQPVYKEAQATASREIGIYADNFERKDMINDNYVAKHVLSKLKGIESVELQKFFSYENTPNGIVLTPLLVSASATMNGPIQVESQRHLTDVQAYLQHQLLAGLGVNKNGPHQVDDQRHISDEQAYLREQLHIALRSAEKGVQSVDSQRHISDEQAYLHEQLLIAVHATQNGLGYIDPYRIHDEHTHIQTVPQIGLGVNRVSAPVQGDFYIDEHAFLQPLQYIGQGVNTSAQAHVDTQPGSTTFYIKEDGTLDVGIGSNIQGIQYPLGSVELSDNQRHIHDPIHVGIGSNTSGAKHTGSRFADEKAYLTYLKQLGLGVNLTGTQHQGERHMNEHSYVQDTNPIGLGSNTHSIQVNGEVDHHEKVKEILLKNMSSTVSIVIQSGSSSDEYQMNGSIQDKVGIVVNSAKGTPLVFHKDNGEPIRLKEYTWKFVKSASGSDRFVIHVPHELELDRKSKLYSVSANPSQSTAVSVNDDVNLRREVRPMSASTNLILSGDIKRVDESVLTNRVEKQTMYTDMMVQSIHPTINRADGATDAFRPHQSVKKQNITQTILRQSQGRFD
jgi:hypothetical protein